jgi:hypothetical protein
VIRGIYRHDRLHLDDMRQAVSVTDLPDVA